MTVWPWRSGFVDKRDTRYEIRDTRYEIRDTRYEIRDTKLAYFLRLDRRSQRGGFLRPA
ncbi:hypothetical protein J2T55_000115 [Methylohalomonas lacus]|uniref:Uncharacterized protein n=1 Tax=Methylohalomonas lacus TaxID=398773 RepID=A0AAE3L3H8_9GAMM|nr:hypothetical protein [Methylohalomonas lacus]